MLDDTGDVAKDSSGNSGNGLRNPGFEYGGKGGDDVWGYWTENAGDGLIAMDSKLVHSGIRAAKLTRSGTKNDTFIGQAVAVVPGTIYQFSFWTCGAGGYGIYNVSAGDYIVPRTTTGITEMVYTQVSSKFTAPPGCTDAELRLFCPDDQGSAYFDDCVLIIPAELGPLSGRIINGKTDIIDGKPVLGFDGISSLVNLYTGSLTNAFPYSEGSALIWARVSSADIWIDGATRILLRFSAETQYNDQVLIFKSATNNRIGVQRYAGGTIASRAIDLDTLQWFSILATWSESLDRFLVYLNGIRQAEIRNIGTWTTFAHGGMIAPSLSCIGSVDTSPPDQIWSGDIAHVALFNRELTADEALLVGKLQAT